MTADFRTIFASIAVRSAENGDQHLVDCLWRRNRHTLDIATMVFTLDDVAKVDGVGLGVGEVFGEYTRKNLKRLSS